eukprot:12012416-Alexandrium_andersonii.AAC.1
MVSTGVSTDQRPSVRPMENKRLRKKRRLDEALYSSDLVGALADFVQNGQYGSVSLALHHEHNRVLVRSVPG